MGMSDIPLCVQPQNICDNFPRAQIKVVPLDIHRPFNNNNKFYIDGLEKKTKQFLNTRFSGISDPWVWILTTNGIEVISIDGDDIIYEVTCFSDCEQRNKPQNP